VKRFIVLATLVCGTPVLADEGMWTYDNFPTAKVKEKYGFEPTPQWLERVRLASAQFNGYCSASFVSGSGLVMTNHHCARECIEQLSTAKKDLIANGFHAKAQAQEVQCPAAHVDQLQEMTDVTERLNTATQGLTGKEYADTLKAEMAKLEKACTTSEQVFCRVVTLYQGGRYSLYKYRRYDDVRLVFAPEDGIASFGGDPDNFEFPRFNIDLTFLRVYEGGKPARTDHHFPWAKAPLREGDLTFVSGQPGGTSRGLTVAQLEFQRDVALPKALVETAEQRGFLAEFQNRGPEQKRVSLGALFYTENGLKVIRGRHKALSDKAFFAQKVAAEQELRQKVDAHPELKQKYGSAWEEIARAQEAMRGVHDELRYIEQARGFASDLYYSAYTLVRAAEERTRPNGERLREFSDAILPGVEARLSSPAPVSPEYEIASLTNSLTKLREVLGVDHPFVKKVLGKESPHGLATRVVKGTKLGDAKVRAALYKGGKAAIAASKDPMIQLAALVDPDARAIRKRYEEDIQAVIKKNSERVAQARFAVYGTGLYPDATGTLRLSYGAVKGYEQDGRKVAPFTTIGGTFERHTGEEPFKLPASWLQAKSALPAQTSMNFISDTDIIGGNSGSPIINKNAELVGLIFDGNIHSIGGEYGFDPRLNRTIAVHGDAILESLRTVYGAQRLLEEMGASEAKAPAVAVPPSR
jgi:hypothetical protein